MVTARLKPCPFELCRGGGCAGAVKDVPGAKARLGVVRNVRAKARTYLRSESKNNGKSKNEKQIPFGNDKQEKQVQKQK